MSVFYLALIPLVAVGYMFFADSQFKKKGDPKYAISTITFNTSVPTGTRSYGYTVNGTPEPVVAAAQVSAPPQGGQVQYVVVTATVTPVPTMTPNPYGTLHATMTELWRLAYTATPFASTALSRPLYDMTSGECMYNCGFITATAQSYKY